MLSGANAQMRIESRLRSCRTRVLQRHDGWRLPILAGIVAYALHPGAGPALAQPAAPERAGVNVPSFWDPKRRLEKPELAPNTVIRFITETDFPPFNYTGADGNPAGFNVDLARNLCQELKATCTVQMRRFDTLVESLAQNRSDAAVASLAATPETRRQVDFTEPYYRTPARFVARRDAVPAEIAPEKLAGKKIGVVSGTAHEAFLKAFFTQSEVRPYPDAEQARKALRASEVDLLFADGIQLAFWLNGSASEDCCAFAGGPYLESRFFGEGIGIALARGNDTLRNALNWALFRTWETGRFTELWLRYFPISPF